MIKHRAAALVLGILLLAAGDAVAGISFDVGVLWEPDPSNDTQVYLHASNIAYPIRRHRVEAVFEQIPRPDLDYPVLAFITYRARVDIRAVWAYRSSGHNWFDVMAHFGLRPDALFVELPGNPKRPNGKAYGYWKKHGNNITARHVSDDDVRFWVSLRTVSTFSGMSVDQVYERHERGEKIRHICGDHHRNEGKGNKNAKLSPGHQKKAGKGGPQGRHQ